MVLLLSKLEKAVRDSWDEETSSDSQNWSPENPAWGQCAVTALVMRDYLGGEITWAQAILPDGRELSHYFNRINEIEFDLTRSQFPENTVIPEGVPKCKTFPSTRNYVLSYPATQRRYELLKKRVQKLLKKFLS